MSKERIHPEIVQAPQLPEVLGKRYEYLVIDPYALNLKGEGPNRGDARLSFYSAFIVNVAREIYRRGKIWNIVLFSDASFGEKRLSTGKLMQEFLVGAGIKRNRIILFGNPELNQTSTQVELLSKLMQDDDNSDGEVLYLSWDYHRERIANHAKGFGVNAKVVSAEEVLKHLRPEFDLDELRAVLPLAKIEKMEKTRRAISRYDTKGIIPRILKPIMGGSYMLDNRKGGKARVGFRRPLEFVYKQGKKRLEEFESTRSA